MLEPDGSRRALVIMNDPTERAVGPQPVLSRFLSAGWAIMSRILNSDMHTCAFTPWVIHLPQQCEKGSLEPVNDPSSIDGGHQGTAVTGGEMV